MTGFGGTGGIFSKGAKKSHGLLQEFDIDKGILGGSGGGAGEGMYLLLEGTGLSFDFSDDTTIEGGDEYLRGRGGISIFRDPFLL